MSRPELLLCSHRGPFVHERVGDQLVASRGAGGLIGAVEPVLALHGGTWIAAAMTEGDRELARAHPNGRDEGGFRLCLLDLPRDEHALFYDVVSNETLWFLFHYLFDAPRGPLFDSSFDSAWRAYVSVNELYADALARAGRADAVFVQDYHLMLVGAMLRRRTRAARPILYFHHTPWCSPDYFSLLPERIGRQILESMLAYDVIGFHAERWARAFSACCEHFLPGALVSNERITWRRRAAEIVVAPVPLDVERLSTEAADARTNEWVATHEDLRAGRKLLLRVDRIDLSKNPLRGFLAYEQLLERRPALAEEAVFLALLYPSRLNIETYQRYYADCLGVVRRINERHESRDAPTGPVELVFEDHYHRSLAAMRACDALLVNPVFDGLNLVAKETAYLNERDAVLVLSQNAGVCETFASDVVSINPFDVSGTADAIETALDLPENKRRRMARSLRRLSARSSPAEWIGSLLAPAGISL